MLCCGCAGEPNYSPALLVHLWRFHVLVYSASSPVLFTDGAPGALVSVCWAVPARVNKLHPFEGRELSALGDQTVNIHLLPNMQGL